MTDFSAWDHKISYSQPGSVDGDKENYPVPITVQYNASYMRSDFGDIRFVLQDGTELKYCIDNLVSGDHCDFLVVFPSLPASPTTTTIWVYGVIQRLQLQAIQVQFMISIMIQLVQHLLMQINGIQQMVQLSLSIMVF